MAIKIFENRAYVDKVALNALGYYFIVSPKKNAGKVWQPGTRGTVYTDCNRSMLIPMYCPHVRLKELPSGKYKTNDPTSCGYAVVDRSISGNVYKQLSEQHLWGIEDTLSDDNVYLFPCDQYVTIDGVKIPWEMGYAAAGDKPIYGCTSYNESSSRARYIVNPKISYKTEFYVIVTTKNTSRSTWFGDPTNFISGISVPYKLPGNVSRVVQLSCIKHAGWQNLNLHGYAVYKYELSSDIAANTSFCAPVIAIAWGKESELCSEPIYLRIQSVYTFKDN